ncbi:MAG: Gfo/Idh/MocA family oxidoreductase [Flavobacteriaceae bacterium]|nr:Gfo/Idh/MocA family oxidoreductase [Flavobacteriaceae bacterium]MCY4267972.1 Gfo/Idh/MocA family oxidoreductase [Flavobacteriaceae bacterium]MCY4299879.1 Gfo/Idh/MocA family oxidoreductase [Flavobacteriaceae bacterium]
MTKIKWGILGLGNIAHKFCQDLKHVKDSKLVAVGSSSLERAKSFAIQYGAEKYYGNYQDLFSDPYVDIIYIASIHPHHAQHSIDAMAAGKSVLCEKPLAMNQSQVIKMIDFSLKKNVFLMEALWTRFNPLIQKSFDLIGQGAIGEITYINASFNFNGMNRSKESRIFNPQKGGGSLLDIGIYCVFLTYLFLGEPQKIHSTSTLSNDGIDLQTAMIFQYKRAQAILHCGFLNHEQMIAEICGTKGEIRLAHQWHNPPAITITDHNGHSDTFNLKTQGIGYTHQIVECHQCLRQNKRQSDRWSHQNSLDLINLLDYIRRKNHIIYPKEIEQ